MTTTAANRDRTIAFVRIKAKSTGTSAVEGVPAEDVLGSDYLSDDLLGDYGDNQNGSEDFTASEPKEDG